MGVYRLFTDLNRVILYCPHTRGGVPVINDEIIGQLSLSPHTWGCTDGRCRNKHIHLIVPTHVGVYRIMYDFGKNLHHCPHTRGGVPRKV